MKINYGMHLDLLGYALTNMMHRKLRSWLTVLGVVIGIASIVALMAIAQGLDFAIRQQLGAFGNDIITVMPGDISKTGGGGFGFGTRTGVLTENDERAVAKVGGILRTGSVISQRMGIEYRGKNASVMVMGAAPVVADIYKMKVAEGRLPQEGDGGAVVLGSTVANKVFDEKIAVNRRVTVSGREFRVVGIFEKSGASGILSFADSLVYMQREDARELSGLYRGNRQVAQITAQLEPNADPKAVEEAVNAELVRLHRVSADKKDFTVISPQFVQDRVGAIFGLLTLFLGGVAGISLIVGGVGIANTMFMSVLERTREIGTLKAIGASSSAILEVFLIESALLGVVGGLIGVAIGWLTAVAANLLGFPAAVSPELAGFSLIFSALVGVLSGVFPARRAAGLEPIEALRYE